MKKIFLLSICTLAFLLIPDSMAKMSAQSNKLYNSAIVSEQEGNYPQALEYIESALRYSPDDAVLNIKAAGIYLNLAKYDEAISAYNKAISLRPQDGFLYISLGNIYMQKNDYQNALNAYERAQFLMPDYKYNYMNIASAKNLIGDSAGSISSYEEFFKAYPNNLEAQSAIANVYLDKKDYDNSIEYFALALRNNPKEFRDYSNYGLALLRKGDYPKAEIAFKSAVGVNKNDSISYANLAYTQLKQDKTDEALVSFQKSVELNGDLCALRYDYAQLLAKKNRTDEAIEQYKAFLKEYPESTNGYIALAQLQKANSNKDAIDTLQNAKKLQPQSVPILLEIASLYQNNADFTDALNYYNDVLNIDKTNSVALYNKGILKTQLGQYQEASGVYNQLLKTDANVLAQSKIYVDDIKSDMLDNQIKMAQELENSNDNKKARAIYSKLLDDGADDYRVYLGMADTSLALGMDTYAKTYYEKAIEIDNSKAEPLMRYAQVLYQLKDFETAGAVLDKALENSKDNPRLYYNKALIDYELKKFADTLKGVQKAISLKADEPDYYYLEALAYESNKDLKSAIFSYEKYIETTADDTQKAKIQEHVKELYDNIVK